MNKKYIHIECPNCHRRFTLEYFAGIEESQMQCSNCGLSVPFSSFLVIEPTYIEPITPVIGQLLVKSTGETYDLMEGTFIVGRTGSEKEADIKLNVSDRTMSRHHLKMTVRKTATNWLHCVKNANNLNPTYINDRKLENNEVVCLNYGDIIRMGKTHVEFIKKDNE